MTDASAQIESAKAVILRAKPVLDRTALYNRDLLMAVLRMLRTRGGYNVAGLLHSLGKINTAAAFNGAVLSRKFSNPLRDILASTHDKRGVPNIRILMSMLVGNGEKTYTAICFTQQKSTQVPKEQTDRFFRALSLLKTAGIIVTEAIFITQAPFSHESETQRKELGTTCFTQLFYDEEVIPPPIEDSMSPSYRVMTDTETREFFEREPIFSQHRMQQISHTDAALKYLGTRPHRVVEIRRKAVLPLAIRQQELTYAWVF